MQSIPFPPPYRGQKDDIPLAVIESPYAEIVKNYNVDDQTASIRYGDQRWTTPGTVSIATLNLATYGTGTAQQMFLVYDDPGSGIKWLDVSSSGAGSAAYSPGGLGGDDEIHTLYFRNILLYFGEASMLPGGTLGPVSYNGTAWANYFTTPASFYTWGSISAPFGGNVYKNRAYIIQKNSSTYGYTEIDSIIGTLTAVDLASILSEKAYLYGIRSIALSEGIEQKNVQAFVMSSGEILVYEGSYPDSDDWQTVGRFVVPPPVYYNSFVDARGDSYVITESALVSLRTLFAQGDEVAVDRSLSAPIANRWKQLVQNQNSALNLYIKGIYDQLNQRIIISFPQYVTTAGVLDTSKAVRLIYSFKTESWVEHVCSLVSGLFTTTPCYYKKNTYYGVGGYRAVMKVEGNTQFLDELPDNTSPGVSYQLRTAPILPQKFGANSISGLEIVQKTDLTASTNYKLIGDLGVQTTTAQILSDQGTGTTIPQVNVGIEAGYVQVDISGTASAGATIGQKIYAMNLWSQPGPTGSR